MDGEGEKGREIVRRLRGREEGDKEREGREGGGKLVYWYSLQGWVVFITWMGKVRRKREG